jgi:hypothetical protein
MSATELGLNLVAQYSNFNVRFDDITKDGTALTFSTVGVWKFGLADSLSGVPIIMKSSTGTLTSGDFVIDSVNRRVTVGVRASEFSYGQGQYYVALWAVTSGVHISHREKYLTIFPQICPTGLV